MSGEPSEIKFCSNEAIKSVTGRTIYYMNTGTISTNKYFRWVPINRNKTIKEMHVSLTPKFSEIGSGDVAVVRNGIVVTSQAIRLWPGITDYVMDMDLHLYENGHVGLYVFINEVRTDIIVNASLYCEEGLSSVDCEMPKARQTILDVAKDRNILYNNDIPHPSFLPEGYMDRMLDYDAASLEAFKNPFVL